MLAHQLESKKNAVVDVTFKRQRKVLLNGKIQYRRTTSLSLNRKHQPKRANQIFFNFTIKCTVPFSKNNIQKTKLVLSQKPNENDKRFYFTCTLIYNNGIQIFCSSKSLAVKLKRYIKVCHIQNSTSSILNNESEN